MRRMNTAFSALLFTLDRVRVVMLTLAFIVMLKAALMLFFA